MKLKEWRTKLGISQSDLAGKLGVSQQNVSYWEYGGRPEYDMMLSIQSHTKGKVTLDDWR